jgi:hypothetical protein
MTTTRRAAVRAARERRRKTSTQPLRPSIVTVRGPSRDRPRPGPVPRIVVRLTRSASAEIRAALEAARHATRDELDVAIEPVEALPGDAPFSLRLPWHPLDAHTGRVWDEGEALASFAAALEAALAPAPSEEAAR